MSEEIASTQQLSVGQMSRRSGVPVSTLHFYESKGLLKPLRTEGNQRLYSRGMLRRIAIIKVAQRVGIPLAEIGQALAAIPHETKPTGADWAQVSAGWAEVLQLRIDTLSRLKNSLESCIGCGCLSLGECPLRNPEDDLGKKHSGAVFLEQKSSRRPTLRNGRSDARDRGSRIAAKP
ncbi:MAG: putative transcriptional regulator, MerR family [Ramlibacter sp.]|nr:putative transcriptional regulator, MerR family [Ramlibacter sp.]